MKPTLVILAAGMGSRYGGLKQLDGIGPHGETIMDYSVHDAVEAGFGKVVFVIRRSMEEDFKQFILSKYQNKIAVEYCFQELDMLPEGFFINPSRQKPYGTAHAIFVAKNIVHEPFTVINADDFYGKDAFQTMAQYLTRIEDMESTQFSMVGYQLLKTLSENGGVSRGVCGVDEAMHLVSIEETHQIQKGDGAIWSMAKDEASGDWLKKQKLAENTIVSMNFWGFTPQIFNFLEKLFVGFLTENRDNLTAEYTIPSVINHILTTHEATITVLRSDAEWFGVTYQEDRAGVAEQLKRLG